MGGDLAIRRRCGVPVVSNPLGLAVATKTNGAQNVLVPFERKPIL